MAAEAEQGGERTEEPSQKRLQDARERGQVPRARELQDGDRIQLGNVLLRFQLRAAVNRVRAKRPPAGGFVPVQVQRH